MKNTERNVLVPLIEYLDFLQYDRSGMLPCKSKGFHEIETGGALPIKKRYHLHLDEMRKQLDDMLQRGVITLAFSEWAAPVVWLKRNLLKVFLNLAFADFCGLNAVIKISVYPIPGIKGNSSLMAGSQ
jgi:hypothetical protein